jgi:hypothetical protein
VAGMQLFTRVSYWPKPQSLQRSVETRLWSVERLDELNYRPLNELIREPTSIEFGFVRFAIVS